MANSALGSLGTFQKCRKFDWKVRVKESALPVDEGDVWQSQLVRLLSWYENITLDAMEEYLNEEARIYCAGGTYLFVQ